MMIIVATMSYYRELIYWVGWCAMLLVHDVADTCDCWATVYYYVPLITIAKILIYG